MIDRCVPIADDHQVRKVKTPTDEIRGRNIHPHKAPLNAGSFSGTRLQRWQEMPNLKSM